MNTSYILTAYIYIHQPKQVLSESVKLANAFSSSTHRKIGSLDSIILDFDHWMIKIGVRYIVSVFSPFHDGSCFHDVTEQRVLNVLSFQ